jgi:hypothetical protein
VHTNYSDGLGSVLEVATAASAAGIDFVIITDHETLQPLADGWEGYHGGCLVLVGAETRVHEGHILALNVPPDHRLAYTGAAAAIECIRKAGGIAFFLPDEDSHFAWNRLRHLPFAGMEVVNLHNLARQAASLPSVIFFACRYFLRGPMAALAQLALRPDGELALWDRLAGERPTSGIASVDAHSRIRLSRHLEIQFPGYRESFRMVQTHILLRASLTGDPVVDRDHIYRALAAGETQLVLARGEEARGVRFWAQLEELAASVGDGIVEGPGLQLCATTGGPCCLLRLFHDGRRVDQQVGREARFASRGPGRYRLEIYRRRGRVGPLQFGLTAWVFTNSITVRSAAERV